MRYSFYICRVTVFSFLIISSIKGTCQTKNDISKNFLLGRYNPSKDTSFIKVSPAYSDRQVYLKKETYKAFLAMYSAALKGGIRLKIISGTRTFYDQKYIWELKWNARQFSEIRDSAEKAKNILRWSSMPGSSRHHWGTDLDLNNINLVYYKTMEGIKLYNWLSLNASRFGFYQPFNPNRSTGYQEEKWHWSYVPLSKIYVREYMKSVTCSDMIGFTGFQTAKKLDIFKNWVSAVNPLCK